MGALIGRWFDLGHVEVISCLLVIFVLLCTTPGDAVRLPRGVSECIIIAGSLSRHFQGGWMVIHLGIVVFVLIILRLWGESPWWAFLL